MEGYYRLGQLQPLLAAFRRFLRLGGKPHRRMADAVVQLCLQQGQARVALQAIRAMQLAGVDAADWQRFREIVLQHQSSLSRGGNGSSSTRSGTGALQGIRDAGRVGMMEQDGSSDSGSGSNPDIALERLKWFLGLPNTYYQSDWRGGQ